MKVNSSVDNFSRSSSARSSRKSNVVLPKSSYSTPTPGSAPKSPSFNYQCTMDAPAHPVYSPQISPKLQSPGCSGRSSQNERVYGNKSPKVVLDSDGHERAVFDFNVNGSLRSPSLPPKSPRSPRFNYDEEVKDAHSSSDGDSFNLQSPPKNKLRMYHRQRYQSSKSDSNNSRSSLEYQSTTRHPTGAYQDIEYKICHSLDSDSQQSDFQTSSSYKYSTGSSRHSSLKDKTRKPRCNIRTNPGYDDRYYRAMDPTVLVINSQKSFFTDTARANP